MKAPKQNSGCAQVNQAAEWLTRLEEGPLSGAEEGRLNAWRQQHPQHEEAWQAALKFRKLLAGLRPAPGTTPQR